MPSKKQRRRQPTSPASAPTGPARGVWWVPMGLTTALGAITLTPRVQVDVALVGSVLAAALTLVAWQILLARRWAGQAEAPSITTVLRPQHYLQALVQASVFAYWGWYWRPVYDHLWLLVAQLLFAYAFDLLLAWSRNERYVLGFGPFPIVFSTNLFLWFRDDWFYLQFVMLAVGFLGKAYVRWEREGRHTHIFNPSAFSLGLFSLVLILTNTSDLTWGQDIASTLTRAPSIYVFLFLAGLVVMYFFAITLIAGSAAITLFGLSALYSTVTGVPYFLDSEIPSAVFLGLHLLVTDPSTSPRTPLGKAFFGVLYGAGVFSLYALLPLVGAPTFYDKLLCVPLLNLSVQGIDRAAQSLTHARGRPTLGVEPRLTHSNLGHMAVWIVFFGIMTAIGSTDGRHRGDSLPFWEGACADGRRGACDRLLQLEASYCLDNSGWACNELGRHYFEGRVVTPDPELALGYFSRACELQFLAACLNLLEPDRLERSDPRPLDLRLLLREGGTNLMTWPEAELYRRACEHAWTFACRGDAD